MVDITNKSNSLRTAIATAKVKVSREETIVAVLDRKVPKGDVLEMSKTAGLFAVKKTSDIIPDCHPLPVESTKITFEVDKVAKEIKIFVEVKTIYKTGVEVEAMHGASVVALTCYDMLKPIDKEIEIGEIKLLQKKGGKSDFNDGFKSTLKAGIVVCSDSISKGEKEDKAGKAIIERLSKFQVTVYRYEVIPDEVEVIQKLVKEMQSEGADMILITGGTGLAPRDVTPEAIRPLLDKEIPGVMEAARSYGQDRTPYSMLSRGVAGLIGKTLVLTLPGSTKGAAESVDALFPAILHIFRVMEAFRHD